MWHVMGNGGSGALQRLDSRYGVTGSEEGSYVRDKE